jgi:hypothetical protein
MFHVLRGIGEVFRLTVDRHRYRSQTEAENRQLHINLTAAEIWANYPTSLVGFSDAEQHTVSTHWASTSARRELEPLARARTASLSRALCPVSVSRHPTRITSVSFWRPPYIGSPALLLSHSSAILPFFHFPNSFGGPLPNQEPTKLQPVVLSPKVSPLPRTGIWTQGLHFEPLPLPFFVMGFFRDRVSRTICPGLTSNRASPDLCLLSS